MVIRNLKQKKILNLRVFAWFIIVCIGIYFLISFVDSISKRFNQSPMEGMYTLGASLTFSGKIVVDNNFPNYTHSLTTKEGEKIGLKSSTINLNTYVGQKIELVGRVKKYFKITPILELDTLKLPDQGLIISNNRYLFVKELMYLDFSSQSQLSASKSGNDVQILFNKKPIVTIERFVCSKILKTRDCSYLVSNYIQTNKDNFESYRKYTFYKHGTGFWTTFDANLFGFLFKDISDDTVLDISTMFRIVNKDFVVENKLDLIKSNCKNDFSQLRTIHSEGTITYKDPYTIILGLQGLDKKNTPTTCKITFDVRNDREVTDVQFN
ncbi:MAG TPA: hypothetical protein PKC87_03175 [Candidatus Absconditabacterales bacterium]|nr:hypothetical protein [Candidatus Absconditabacterales bacterium]